MNRRRPHKLYSEKVCQSAEHQDGGNNGCKWQDIEENVTWASLYTEQIIMCIYAIWIPSNSW